MEKDYKNYTKQFRDLVTNLTVPEHNRTRNIFNLRGSKGAHVYRNHSQDSFVFSNVCRTLFKDKLDYINAVVRPELKIVEEALLNPSTSMPQHIDDAPNKKIKHLEARRDSLKYQTELVENSFASHLTKQNKYNKKQVTKAIDNAFDSCVFIL